MLKVLGFIRCMVNACLLIRINEQQRIVIFCIYVDDSNCVGHRKAIDYITKELKKKFKIKNLGPMKESIGCTIKRDKDGFQLSQPDIIKKLQYQFGVAIKVFQVYHIPMASGHHLMRAKEGNKFFAPDKQTEYWSRVETLLYLVKHSCLDIANVI